MKEKQLGDRPTRYEVAIGNKRTYFEAAVNEDGKPVVRVHGVDSSVQIRLTPNKASGLIPWLEKYTAWADSFKND